MGLVYAEIELINGGDIEMVRRGFMDKDEVKRMWVTALVDTGAYMLCINENIQEQLDLRVLEKRKGQMADGTIVEHNVVGPIELKFKNRRTLCNAMVPSRR
jgi:predicted aspartyl protease